MSEKRETYPAPRHDPVTGEPLLITRLEGPTTGIAIEGRFTFGGGGRLNTLGPEHLAFVEVFIKNRGIIKDVEAELGISYPTVRARLDEVIRAMGYAPYPVAPVAPAPLAGEAPDGVPSPSAAGATPGSDDERRALLADVAAGRIPASEAAKFIRRQERDARRAERDARKERTDAREEATR